MSYLLWQIFACLFVTALLFLALGWLLRGWLRRNDVPEDLITGSERTSWQTSLEGFKARLEAETGRKLATEKALEDARGQASKLSSLLDQQSTEIRNLSQELTDKNRALSERDASLKQLQGRVADQTVQQGAAADFAHEREAFTTQIAALTSQAGVRDQSLQAANDELAKLKAQIAPLESQVAKLQGADTELGKLRVQVADLEPKLRAATEENSSLKAQVSELTPKLAMAAAAGAEIGALKAHVAQLEPQVSKLQTSDVELGKLRSQLDGLQPQLADRDAKLRTAHDDLVNFKKRWVEQEGKFQAFGEENSRLKAQLAEYEPKLRQVESLQGELTTLRLRLTTIEPQIQDWETRYKTTVAEKDAELSKCRSRVMELGEQISKQQALPFAPDPPQKIERDDLKKIYGIGPVLEKRLNSLGVYFFREIAMWTQEDVLRYEEHLKEFPNRIERDHWVEGAREQHFKKYGEQLFQAKSAEA